MPLRPGKPTTPPVAALLTPSTQFSRKRKSLTDVDDGVPSLRTKLNDRFLNPSSGGELGQYTLDNEGHWEKRVREALQIRRELMMSMLEAWNTEGRCFGAEPCPNSSARSLSPVVAFRLSQPHRQAGAGATRAELEIVY
ncbi:hypothetical protein BGZ61DRAFT_74784 [Ilyonectria robusta]|uniref:uncharacterized protein n=1 Tax=Ilyonectria robusta TaxID=1079257 RepID=UPI001E8D1623|nr:uncharacterized protein BGZ61DRAFT_74784 [Ilyonectria robusta]KAH8677109.1 hypothetical protein BGZ61DRAFT_74784 [Ilyonectria robusta]